MGFGNMYRGMPTPRAAPRQRSTLSQVAGKAAAVQARGPAQGGLIQRVAQNAPKQMLPQMQGGTPSRRKAGEKPMAPARNGPRKP